MNIALVNELSILADRMGIDIWEVVDAASTKPYGFMRFEPGPGMGGHCLPVDPFYLTWRAREFHMSTEFIELAGKINQQMPHVCVERIERALNNQAKPINGSRIAILGVSYKGGTGDIRESPALRIIETLAERGARLTYHDPYVPALPEHSLQSTSLADAVPAPTPLSGHRPPPDRPPRPRAGASLFIDLRGVTRKLPDREPSLASDVADVGARASDRSTSISVPPCSDRMACSCAPIRRARFAHGTHSQTGAGRWGGRLTGRRKT